MSNVVFRFDRTNKLKVDNPVPNEHITTALSQKHLIRFMIDHMADLPTNPAKVIAYDELKLRTGRDSVARVSVARVERAAGHEIFAIVSREGIKLAQTLRENLGIKVNGLTLEFATYMLQLELQLQTPIDISYDSSSILARKVQIGFNADSILESYT